MRCLVLGSLYLSGEVCGTTLGHLQDDWGLCVAGRLEGSNDGGGGGDVLSVLVCILLIVAIAVQILTMAGMAKLCS